LASELGLQNRVSENFVDAREDWKITRKSPEIIQEPHKNSTSISEHFSQTIHPNPRKPPKKRKIDFPHDCVDVFLCLSIQKKTVGYKNPFLRVRWRKQHNNWMPNKKKGKKVIEFSLFS
jgi:L-ribulose-5-phosphate 3-epimerase UlaE